MAAHRYWRIYAFKNAGDASFIQFAEVQMRVVAGGADQCTGGTPSCSGSLQAGSAAGIFANDGATTFAQWSGTTDKWAKYDFGAGNAKDIVEVVLTGATGAASRTPAQFIVQSSDDNVNWTNEWAVSRTAAYTTNVDVVFTKPAAAASYRYWRCRIGEDGSWDVNVVSISKMEMRLVPGGADQCTGGAGVRYADNGANVIANAFDGNSATFYATTDDSHLQYFGYNFGAGNDKAINAIYLVPRQDSSNFRQWPLSLWVEASADGISWLPQWANAFMLQPAYNGSQGYEFINPDYYGPLANHRWWGIRVLGVQSGSTLGLDEIQFRATVGGADNTSGGVGLARSVYDWSMPGTNAFSGTADTHASDSGDAVGHIIAYDYGLGNDKACPAQISIKARADGGFGNHNQAPTSFQLVYSDDGHNWTAQEGFVTAAWTSASTQLFTVTPPVGGGRRRHSAMLM